MKRRCRAAGGGDAKTDAGFEIGSGVAYADMATGLSVEARVLVAHTDSDCQE
ncbi:MAG: hypothetical protein OXP66_14120 [Candidatus Tectomicrobia bacterium]|nr:hypothetical protein [Candidatus Tectomicrobia bacterium]